MVSLKKLVLFCGGFVCLFFNLILFAYNYLLKVENVNYFKLLKQICISIIRHINLNFRRMFSLCNKKNKYQASSMFKLKPLKTKDT